MFKKKYLKNLYISIFLIFSIAFLVFLGELLMPKYRSAIKEGALTGDYYFEKVPHDVIFLGDCEVFENFSPVTLWENFGISSYVRGSAQQLIWQSYWLLEEVFVRETPKIVVYNVQAMKYSEPQKEAYNRMTIDGMSLSIFKLRAAIDSMTEGETLLSYVFPILRFHERWKELKFEDFEYVFKSEPVSDSGYLMRCDIKPMEMLPEPPVLTDYNISEKCFSYLKRMKELCEKNSSELVLIKSPSLYPHWYDEWDKQIEEFAKSENLRYINFLNSFEEIGLDMSRDSYDAGLHLNVYGAEKLSLYFGKYLADEFEFGEHDKNTILLWDEKCSVYHARKAFQEKEFRELGYITGIK